MPDCRTIDPLVTPFVDGEASAADRTLVEQHITRCPPCRSRVVAEQAMRRLLQTRQDGLRSRCAPPLLRAACAGHADAAANRAAWRLAAPVSWRARLIPLATAASFVLVVGGVFVYQATEQSSRVLAAELAADHLKCFTMNAVLGTQDSPEDVERAMMSGFGWAMQLPGAIEREGLALVGSRPCLYAEGKVAHIMYRHNGQPVSLFMLPRTEREDQIVKVLGHECAIWSMDNRTFVLVTRESRADVEHLAAFVQASVR
jgi:anti-sigma factor RsiW